MQSPVKTYNQLLWDGVRRPFFETYQFLVPATNRLGSLMFRYSIAVPESPLLGSFAEVSVFGKDEKNEPFMLSEKFDLATTDVIHAEDLIRIGNCGFSVAGFRGELGEGNQRLVWDFVFEDPALSICVQPHRFLANRWFAMAPRLTGHVTGKIYFQHRSHPYFRSPLYQDHEGGLHPVAERQRLMAAGFREDSEAVFLAEMFPVWKKNRVFAFLRAGGLEHSIHGLWAAFMRSEVKLTEDACEFVLFHGRRRFDVKACFSSVDLWKSSVPVQMMQTFFYKLLALTSLEIDISRKQRGLWQEEMRLTSPTSSFVSQWQKISLEPPVAELFLPSFKPLAGESPETPTREIGLDKR